MEPGLETTEHEEALSSEDNEVSKILVAVCHKFLVGCRCQMTYTIDKHSDIDGGSDGRTIFGIAF